MSALSDLWLALAAHERCPLAVAIDLFRDGRTDLSDAWAESSDAVAMMFLVLVDARPRKQIRIAMHDETIGLGRQGLWNVRADLFRCHFTMKMTGLNMDIGGHDATTFIIADKPPVLPERVTWFPHAKSNRTVVLGREDPYGASRLRRRFEVPELPKGFMP